jgi:cellulose 1,4-beta-cellobiosidase
MASFYLARVVLSLFQARYLLAQRLDGSNAVEMHPPLTWSQCALAGSCSLVNAFIVETNEAPWFDDDSGTHCWVDHVWNSTICPNAQTCYDHCSMHATNYGGKCLYAGSP